MSKLDIDFLEEMINTPSPSGFEQKLQRKWRNYITPFADKVEIDVHGNSIGIINPDAKLKVMLVGHSDEVGFIVVNIDDDGYIYLQAIGGVDPSIMPGKRIHIYHNDEKILGVIGKKPIHLSKTDSQKEIKIYDLWVDIGATNKEEAEKRVQVGDIAVFSYGFEKLTDDIIVGRGLDNRAGIFIVAEVLKKMKENKPQVAVYGVSSVQEEIGLRGAKTSSFHIQPDVGIAIDVTHATDYPTMKSNKQRFGDIKLGGGPVISIGPNTNPIVLDFLKQSANDKKIKYQLEAEGRATGTDANALQISGRGIATGLISIPNRYMHTPIELVSIKDMEEIVDLLVEFILKLAPDTSFIPK